MPLPKATQKQVARRRTCKTCTPCRQKKIKCDGSRPQCLECSTAGLSCAYPHDARRDPRPSRARVQSLEDTISVMLEHMKTAGIIPPQVQPGDWIPGDGSEDCDGLDQTLPLPTPSTSVSAESKRDVPQSAMFSSGAGNAGSPGQVWDLDTGIGGVQQGEMQIQIQEPRMANELYDTVENGTGESGMSPCEARVAGAFHEHGCVSSVNGLASIMNPASRAQHKENISQMARKGDGAIAASEARLVSNAALQRQREPRIFRQPSNLVELDGCEPELAKHLLDLHFNRQHYAYLISYRPAIMESLADGSGPWLNKLLLNAIYYSGTLYSDRECLRSDPDNPNSLGSHFYRRFRQLLVDEIGNPSIPSAAALLLMSATLVSQGQSSAGWNLSGTAYRMIIDMGCHLMLGSDYQSESPQSHRQLVRRDLEQEMRRRLYWGAFVTDATQALYLGRPCMFATAEARVPLQFLDKFEELEDWEPYLDPLSHVELPPPYAPQAAHAVSTFSWLARLFQISTRIIDLYGIQVIRCSSQSIQDKKAAIEKDLEYWSASLPENLKFDPDGPLTPPPHQITPHTTFHALNILLHRAFLEEGHLRRHPRDEADRQRSEATCIASALAIQKLVRAYKRAFTLRRAPFLLSYAVYSAVIVIIRQERHAHGQFMEPISFFWTCLSELQRGCNFGLQKPLNVLRDMVHEFQVSAEEAGAAGYDMPSLDEAFSLPVSRPDAQRTVAVSPGYMDLAQPDSTSMAFGFGASSPGFLASLNQLESDLSQDSLYGLFAPPSLFS
ncbi:fungal-specific transcription factor domain-containing protein [Aspergillus californicus]